MVKLIFFALGLMLLCGCSNTFHHIDGHSIDGRIVGSDSESLRIQPELDQVLYLVDLGVVDATYKGGPVEIPSDHIHQTDNRNTVAAGILGSLSALTFLTSTGSALVTEFSDDFYTANRALSAAFGVLPFTIVFAFLAPPFILESLDHDFGGSYELRIGAAIGGTAIAVLAPTLIAVFPFTRGDGSLSYLASIMPTAFAAGLSILAWGWARYDESRRDEAIQDLFVSPTVLFDLDQKSTPGVAFGFTW